MALGQDTDGLNPGGNVIWAVIKKLAGSTISVLGINPGATGDLTANNQLILGCGMAQANQAPNIFYAKGCKLEDGDEVYLSLVHC